MPPTRRGPSPPLRWTRTALVVGYAAFVGLGLVSAATPRVFWTILLPLLPLSVVVMGFHPWRQICPLAWFGEVGRALNRGPQRRAPAWLERWFFPVTFGILLAMLVLRLVATNGDPVWLSGLLLGAAVAAAATNAAFTGKTWCNFVCPVGFVERVYTEPGSLRSTSSSLCVQCTACKRHCPDIDQENAYWKDLSSRGRQLAIYGFPGLVLAFYTYYWLRHGDWEAYFDGRWTRWPVDRALVTGPGFFFAPGVPALLAATLTLLVFSAASYGLFLLVEGGLRAAVGDADRGRHLGLALAAFTAFNLFYVFAGAPSLRQVPGGLRFAAFVAPLVGTLFLVKRWRRTPEQFIGERGATRLLRTWPFDEPPPKDPGEVYGWIKASRHAREKDVAAYAATVQGMVADGLVRSGDLRLLDGMRQQLGISEREHEQILARLSEEERQLLEGGGAGIEEHVQLEGYQMALAEALMRTAPQEEIDELRLRFGVSESAHETALARIRGSSGEILSRARRQLDRARRLQGDLAAFGGAEPTAAQTFLGDLLARARNESLERLLELLEIAGDGPVIQSLRRRLFSADPAQREPALKVLALACPGAEDLIRELGPLLGGRPPAAPVDGSGQGRVLARLLGEADPFLRAGAVWAAAGCPDESLRAPLARARDDAHPLVRETAACFAGARPGGHSSIETLHFLHRAPFFADLDPSELYDIAQLSLEETIAPPATLCDAGDTDSDALFVIVDGEAAVVAPPPADAPGTGRVVATLRRGDLVGELSVLDGSPRSATVRPEGGPLRVLRIPGPRLRAILLSRPRATESLLRVLAGRLRGLLGLAANPE
jgi:hypothetical protein